MFVFACVVTTQAEAGVSQPPPPVLDLSDGRCISGTASSSKEDGTTVSLSAGPLASTTSSVAAAAGAGMSGSTRASASACAHGLEPFPPAVTCTAPSTSPEEPPRITSTNTLPERCADGRVLAGEGAHAETLACASTSAPGLYAAPSVTAPRKVVRAD